MINYCETDQCLRQFILSYFGDTSPCTCDKCSNCVVVEDEPEELYLTSGKTKKKTLQLADLTPTGQELFEQLRKCRADLASERSVPPYIICSDKTLKDMCTKCPTDDVTMAAVYGMGVQKIASYGADFTSIISDFLKNHDTEAISSGDSLTMETDSETAPAPKKKKLPFYIAPEKLNLVELTAKTNTLCDDPARKKLTAAFVNQLLIEKGYLEELKNYFLGLL